MPNYGSQCRGCGGEDCVCCEVYQEYRSDQLHPSEPEDFDEDNDFFDDEDTEDFDEDNDLDESMDGDFDSGMASAGLGTNEDYGDWGHDGMNEE